ncbi:MAG: class I SAM-dependent methyltransferase [Mycobacterium sp.]|nr:class I SAM-dependent methyltransferase [Mycobacterium sp.]
MVARARALATRNRDPLVEDRFAEPLVRAAGVQTFTSVLDGDIGIADQDGTTLLSDLVAVRTRFKNNFFADAAEAGIRQAVILAAGRRTVGIDLRDDWRAALRAEGFDEATPSAWIAELSTPGSRFATDYHPAGGVGVARRTSSISDQWAEHGLELYLGDLFPGGRRRPVEDQLDQLGCRVTLCPRRPRPEMFASYGRHLPEGEANAALRKARPFGRRGPSEGVALRKALYVTAIRK